MTVVDRRQDVSHDTKAILALSARGGPRIRDGSARPLSATEYHELTLALRERSLRPADLFSAGVDQLADIVRAGPPQSHEKLDPARLHALLRRGALIALRLSELGAQGIWVVGRGDAGYPTRYRTRLGSTAPPILYGCGPQDLLQRGGLAVVGSREPDDASVRAAEQAGVIAADAGIPVISGAARGVDELAMLSAIERGGESVGVLAESLLRLSVRRNFREGIRAGRLTLVTAYEPDAGFTVGHAMGRNRLIYALAETAFVVASSEGRGGTWAGALEALRSGRRVYTIVGNPLRPGNEALLEFGALAVRNPTPAILNPKNEESEIEGSRRGSTSAEANAPEGSVDLATGLADAIVPFVLAAVASPATTSEVAKRLDVASADAKRWLHRLLERGLVRLHQKSKFVRIDGEAPVVARAHPTASRQLALLAKNPADVMPSSRRTDG